MVRSSCLREGVIKFVMKSKRSSVIWIILSFIMLLTGMCSQIERTDSFLQNLQYMSETDTIDNIESDTLYIGNCTSKLITGLRDSFQKSRRGQVRIHLRSFAEFLWIKEILQMLSYVCIAALFVCQPIEHSKVAILNYIHSQDGEK